MQVLFLVGAGEPSSNVNNLFLSVSVLVATPSECTSAESSDEVRQATPIVSDRARLEPPMDAPHSWLCNGRLLRLLDPRAPGNVKAFEKRWKRGEVT